MNVDSISINGFANLREITLNGNLSAALVAPNSYGKSNVLSAISFGLKFMKASEEEKRSMMSDARYMPINKNQTEMDYHFEITGNTTIGDNEYCFIYAFSFAWGEAHGKITTESLKVKGASDPKYKSYIERKDGKPCLYLPSPTGRCSKQLENIGHGLTINKLATNDVLFFVDLIRDIVNIDIPYIDSLENPNAYFSADGNGGIAMLGGKTISAYLHYLKTSKSDCYSLLTDAIYNMLPHVESIEPIEITLGEGRSLRLYDINVKERNNRHATSIQQISSGSKRVIFILTLCMAADINHIPMIMLEEPENSVHPRLLQNLLTSMRAIAMDAKVLMTSRSPYLMRYLGPEQLYLGLPNDTGLAEFGRLKQTKIKSVYRRASEMDITFGEYMYEMLLDMEDDKDIVNEYFQR